MEPSITPENIPPMPTIASEVKPLYEQDFFHWTQEQAKFLRANHLDQLDLMNLAEEIESLGKQQQQELENQLGLLLGHLLKWWYQPDARSKSWRATIHEQRRQIRRLVQKNPSLQSYWQEAMAVGYQNALDLVDRETPLNPKRLPQTCPFSLEQIFEDVIDFPED